jgi:hypothetical protein
MPYPLQRCLILESSTSLVSKYFRTFISNHSSLTAAETTRFPQGTHILLLMPHSTNLDHMLQHKEHFRSRIIDIRSLIGRIQALPIDRCGISTCTQGRSEHNMELSLRTTCAEKYEECNIDL